MSGHQDTREDKTARGRREDRVRKAVELFLQSAIVIDDQATLGEAEVKEVEEANPPESPVDVLAVEVTDNSGEAAPVVPSVDNRGTAHTEAVDTTTDGQAVADTFPAIAEQDSSALYAKNLAESFLDQGILCTTYRPLAQEDISRLSIAATKADIVIVDWILKGKDSQKAIQFIKQLVSKDKENGGRLRLICVYTSQTELRSESDKLLEEIGEGFQKVDDKEMIGLKGAHTRIAFVVKRRGERAPIENEIRLSEGELTDYLVGQFAALCDGLLQSTAVACIGTIRDRSHWLLGSFSSTMDGAYVGHRMMIPNASDASGFLGELFLDDFRCVLSQSRTVEEFAGDSATREWVEKLCASDHKFRDVFKHEYSADEMRDVHDGTLSTLTRKLASIHEKRESDRQAAADAEGKKRSKQNPPSIKKIHKDWPLVYYKDEAAFDHGVQSLSEKSALPGESMSIRITTPSLTLGTILKVEKGTDELATDTLLVCLQPRCDCLRMKKNENRKFIFLKLTEDSKQAQIYLSGVGYSFRAKPNNYFLLNFVPNDPSEQFVVGEEKDGIPTFKSGPIELRWLSEMKALHAQKLSVQVGNSLSRVGFDDFEWLRLRSETEGES